MAYSVVPTVISGDSWTAGNNNTYVRDNFKAGIPDIFTAAGDMAYGTAANAATNLAIGNPYEVLAVNSGATAPEWLNKFDGCCLYGTAVSSTATPITIPDLVISSYKKAIFSSVLFSSNSSYWSAGDPDAVTIPQTGVYKITVYADATSSPHTGTVPLIIGPNAKVIFMESQTAFDYYYCTYIDKFTQGDDAWLGYVDFNIRDVLTTYTIQRLIGL